MKKILTLAMTMALTAGAAGAIDWTQSVENLAKGGEVTVSTNFGAAATITDGDNGSSWQATGGANKIAPDFVLINLGEQKRFTDVQIIWEASHPTDYSVYVSSTAIPYEEKTGAEANPELVYNEIDSDWLAAATPVAVRRVEGNEGATDEFTLDSAVSGQYVLVLASTYNGWATNYGSRMFELRLALVEGRDTAAALKVTDASVMEGKSTQVNVTAVNAAGEPLDLEHVSGMSLISSNPEAVHIEGGENGVYTVTGLTTGRYTLTATATNGEGETVSGSAQLIVNYDWASKENLATGKTAYGRLEEPEAEDYEYGAAMAVDGDESTYFTFGTTWGGCEAWLIVDLGAEYVVDAVGASYGDHSNGKFRVLFGSMEAELPSTGNMLWSNELSGWERSASIDRSDNTTATYIPEYPVTARYVGVLDTDCPGGVPQVKELYISGVLHEVSVATTIEVRGDRDHITTDESVRLSATVYDQYGAIMADAAPTFSYEGTDLADGIFTATTDGVHTVTATYGKLSADLEINVIAVADTKVPSANVVTTFGGQPHTSNPLAGNEVQWTNDDMGIALEIDLGEEYDLKIVKLRWEAACPSDYTVSVRDYDGNNERVVFELSGRAFEGGVNPIDRIVHTAMPEQTSAMLRAAAQSSASLDGVRYVTVTPTDKTHGYNLRLFGVDAYGTSNDKAVTGIDAVESSTEASVNVYNMQGMAVRRNVSGAEATAGLPAGMYIVGSRKVIVK